MTTPHEPVQNAIALCVRALPVWLKWRRVRLGYEPRCWYRRIMRMR